MEVLRPITCLALPLLVQHCVNDGSHAHRVVLRRCRESCTSMLQLRSYKLVSGISRHLLDTGLASGKKLPLDSALMLPSPLLHV